MKFVNGKDARDFFHIVLDVEYINTDRRALKQDLTALPHYDFV